MGRNARRTHGQDVVGEGKSEVKERLGWVAISRHILGCAISGLHRHPVPPYQHCGSCPRERTPGRSVEAYPLLKGDREGDTSQKFLLLKEMELGGRTEVMVGLVPAGVSMVVTVHDSSVLCPAVPGSGDRCIHRESEREFIPGH